MIIKPLHHIKPIHYQLFPSIVINGKATGMYSIQKKSNQIFKVKVINTKPTYTKHYVKVRLGSFGT
jgi:hypothetical protein